AARAARRYPDDADGVRRAHFRVPVGAAAPRAAQARDHRAGAFPRSRAPLLRAWADAEPSGARAAVPRARESARAASRDGGRRRRPLHRLADPLVAPRGVVPRRRSNTIGGRDPREGGANRRALPRVGTPRLNAAVAAHPLSVPPRIRETAAHASSAR